MKEYRLKRLFNANSGRCFDVAIDHGCFNQYGFLGSIEDASKAISTVVNAGPDAVQLTVGQAKHLQSVPGRQKPSLVDRKSTCLTGVHTCALRREQGGPLCPGN